MQGSGYNLYDPGIATSDELENRDDELEKGDEKYFCRGNLNEAAFNTFFQAHKCNIYCEMLSLIEVEITTDVESDTE